ncbi:hypothetical protein OsJ_29746 [Oryza sativa Japonica Group]|uniref:FAS1 domain-containing protein n=1 Tax=Oryza sativa subsp. japonica TaxID=39947 RepID=B9G457_ORYSJ|nr:hypothetical protein OsJ_29746 [Oryza sativa Japonica Group]
MRRLRLAAAAAAPHGVLLLLLILLPLVAAAGPAAAKAPAAPPVPPNVTTAMAKGGAFLPRYKNLTADGKAELLLFHAVPVYYSRGSLKSNNGVMNTLATDGAAKNYNFTVQNEGDAVTIKTAASGDAARVKSTVVDADPVAIFTVDAVIEPVELFKPAPSPTPAPSPAPAADAPKASKPAHHPAPVVADAPGPAATDSPPADQKKEAKKSAAAGAPPCVRWFAAAFWPPSPWPPHWPRAIVLFFWGSWLMIHWRDRGVMAC